MGLVMENCKLITGTKTYYVRDSIKASGGKWDAAAKGWWVPNPHAAEVELMLASVPVQHSRSSRPPSGVVLKPGARNMGTEVIPVAGPTVAKATPRTDTVAGHALLENSKRVTQLRAEAVRLLQEADELALLCISWSRTG